MNKLFLSLGLFAFLSLASTSVFAMPSQYSPEMAPCASSNTVAECPCNKSDDCGFKSDDCCEKKCPCEECYNSKRDELYSRLNLDNCQKQEAKCIENAYKPSLDKHKEIIKRDHKCLCEKINAKCLDKSAIRAQERVLKHDFKDMKSTLKAMDKEFKKILKCDQKSEYRKFKREMKYRVKKGVKYCCKPCKSHK